MQSITVYLILSLLLSALLRLVWHFLNEADVVPIKELHAFVVKNLAAKEETGENTFFAKCLANYAGAGCGYCFVAFWAIFAFFAICPFLEFTTQYEILFLWVCFPAITSFWFSISEK